MTTLTDKRTPAELKAWRAYTSQMLARATTASERSFWSHEYERAL